MQDTTRRRFIGVTGAGAAAVAVAPAAAYAGGTSRSRNSADEPVGGAATSARRARCVGERAGVLHHRDLVARILNAAGR